MKKRGLFLSALIGCCLLAGCGSSDNSATAMYDAYSDSAATMSESTMAEDNWYDYEEVDVAMEADTDGASVTFAQNKKLIYKSSVVLETKTYDETYDRLIQLINENGGYIEYENYSNENRSYLADNEGSGVVVISTNILTIRIPSKNYSKFMQDGLTLGNVLHRNQSIEDKTTEYNTNKSYVDILKDEVEYLDKQLNVLEEELKTAQANDKHYDDIIANMKDVASRKAQVEKELVPYQTVLDDIDEKVEFSTIEMELREVDKFTVIEPEEVEEEETFLSQVETTWNNSMERLGNLFKGTLLFIINILPALIYLLVFGAIALGIVKLVKKILQGRKANSPVAYVESAPENTVNVEPAVNEKNTESTENTEN